MWGKQLEKPEYRLKFVAKELEKYRNKTQDTDISVNLNVTSIIGVGVGDIKQIQLLHLFLC